jgi:dipeptidyl aminopeptidase/acylaminoacyl peptidase
MQSISIDDLLKYRFLSGARISPTGKRAAFLVKRAEKDENDYLSDIYLVQFESGETKRLTTSGKEGPFVWTKDGTGLLFVSRRQSDNDEQSPLYKIDIDGGEAERIGNIPHKIETLELVDETKLLYTARVTVGDDKGDDPDFEILTEIPFWQNSKGFTSERRVGLFSYDIPSGNSRQLVGGPLELEAFDQWGTKVAFIAKRFTGKAPITDELYLLDLETGELDCLSKEELAMTEVRFLSGSRLALLGTAMSAFGLGQSRDVMTIDLNSREWRNLTPGWDRLVGNRIVTDCRHGGGPISQIDKGMFYTVVTEREASYIYAIDKDGNYERLFNTPGSIDSFDVGAGKLVYVAMRTGCLQELYLFESGKERQLTHLNTDNTAKNSISTPTSFSVSTADGEKIDARLMRPPDFSEDRRYPAILEIHGGPKGTYGTIFNHEMQVLAGAGYVVTKSCKIDLTKLCSRDIIFHYETRCT